MIVTAAREGERTGEGDEREGESKWMMEPLWFWFCPPVHRGCASLRQAKQRTHGGVQEEENKMKDGGGTERRVKVHWL